MRKVDYLIHGKELSVKLRFMSPQMEKSFKRIISNIHRHIIIGIHAIVQIYLVFEGTLQLFRMQMPSSINCYIKYINCNHDLLYDMIRYAEFEFIINLFHILSTQVP